LTGKRSFRQYKFALQLPCLYFVALLVQKSSFLGPEKEKEETGEEKCLYLRTLLGQFLVVGQSGVTALSGGFALAHA